MDSNIQFTRNSNIVIFENKAIYPEEIANFLRENMSFSTSANDLNHQGPDFCLEGKIKRIKMMAPKGQVADVVWKQICQSVDKVEQIQTNVNNLLGNTYTDG